MVNSIEIRSIGTPEELSNADLRARALKAKGVSVTSQFVAALNGVEAGYLSMDHRPDRSCAVPYDVFVLPKFRKVGVGSALLAAAEALGATCGYRVYRLSVAPSERECGEAVLVGWYEKRGYRPAADSTGEYEKELTSSASGTSIACEPSSRRAQETFVKVIDMLLTGETLTLPHLKDRLVRAGCEIMKLQPQDITEYFRSEFVQLQYLLNDFSRPSGKPLSRVESMNKDELIFVLGLVGVLGITTGALPVDRTQLNS